MNENIWVLYVLISSTTQLESCFREYVPVRLRTGRKRNCTALFSLKKCSAASRCNLPFQFTHAAF